MTPEQMRIKAAESAGWKWYRHPSSSSIKHPHYRFLAHPAIHEYDGQSPNWKVPADGTEGLCALDYMEKEFYLPPYDTSLDAVAELEKTLTCAERGFYVVYLRAVVLRDCTPDQLDPDTGMQQDFFYYCATTSQRLECYLKSKGLWEGT